MTLPEQQFTDFILADANRLSIAQDADRVMYNVRKLLIATFLSNVAAAIRLNLGSNWIVNSRDEHAPGLLNDEYMDLLTVRHCAWPTVFVGIENAQNVGIGVWSDPAEHALTPHWATIQVVLEPLGLTRRPQAPDEWWPARANLGSHGFFSDFLGRPFLELARQIRRNEAQQAPLAACASC
jgi:hypothetical protein